MIGRRELVGAACAGLVFGSPAAHAAASRKGGDTVFVNALVIGMRYSRAPASFYLGNTIADAHLVADFFNARGNARTTLLDDPTTSDLVAAVLGYAAQLKPTDLALIYYAGHGVQIGGTNYIVSSSGDAILPINAVIDLARRTAHLAVVILDACRNNPFSSEESTKHFSGARAIRIVAPGKAAARPDGDPIVGASLGMIALSSADVGNANGLAQLRLTGPGVKVILSTDPGNVAYDTVGGDRDSPFTTALVRELSERKSLDEVLADVTHDVITATNGKQTPWVQGSLDETIYISGKPKRFDHGDLFMPTP